MRATGSFSPSTGARRANSVREFMVAHGIDPSRLEMTSYGKERPAIVGSDEAVWDRAPYQAAGVAVLDPWAATPDH